MADLDPALDPGSKLPTTYVASSDYESYICSFSKASDDLAMWNYYVKGSGYDGFNIGIDPSKMKCYAQQRTITQGFRFSLVEVVYDKKEKERLIETMIEKVYGLFREVTEDSITKKQTVDFIEDYLDKLRFWFKSDFFKHEQEVRAIIDLPTKHLEDAKEQFEPEIQYRRNNCYTIPYFEFPIENNCIVKSVMIGPSGLTEQQQQIQLDIMKQRLQKDYPTASVDYSKAPVRY